MKIDKLDLINENVINSKNFKSIKIKTKCTITIFEKYPNESFIFVLEKNGKVIIYEKNHKNTFTNLREVIGLFGSDFFDHSIINEPHGIKIKESFENNTGLSVRNIYQTKI